MDKDKSFKTKWLPIFLMAIALIIVYKTLDNLDLVFASISNFLRVISPFLFSILIVYFLYTPCKALEKTYKESTVKFLKKRARGFSVVSVYIMMVFVLGVIGTFIVPVIVQSLLDLASNIPVYYDHIINFLYDLPDRAGIDGLDLKSYLLDFASTTLVFIFDPTRVEAITRGIIGFASGLFNVVISLIVSMYILIEREKIGAFANRLSKSFFKEKTEKQTKKYLAQINKVVFTFIGSKGLDSIINLIVVTSILLIFRVEYALLLGLLAGLANFIPYLGSLIAVIVITLLTALTGGASLALKVFIALIIFQQIDGNYIEPRIMKTNLKISPILVIFSVIVGGAYFGIVGMFLAVPIATIIKQILIEYMDSNKRGEIIKK